MKSLIALTSLLILLSCNPKPEEIHYGEDNCNFCSMTIVDKQHAAQMVTKKGKVYKFDAAECLIQNLTQFDEQDIAFVLVTDYSTPTRLVDARTATFIVSPEIPSPMRANLSALSSLDTALNLQREKSGKLFSWQEIQIYLQNK